MSTASPLETSQIAISQRNTVADCLSVQYRLFTAIESSQNCESNGPLLNRMEEFMEALQYLISGLICGVILFQTALVAPSLFKLLSTDDIGAVLRHIFPKFFIALLILGIALMASALLVADSFVPAAVALITIVAMFICYGIVPATNAARDTGRDKDFQKLHSLSVGLTLIVLLANALWFLLA